MPANALAWVFWMVVIFLGIAPALGGFTTSTVPILALTLAIAGAIVGARDPTFRPGFSNKVILYLMGEASERRARAYRRSSIVHQRRSVPGGQRPHAKSQEGTICTRNAAEAPGE